MNLPLYLIRFRSLYPLNNSVTDWFFFFFFFFVFFFFFWYVCVCVVCVWGGGAVVTVDVNILCLLFFSAHAIFDDPVKVIW